MDFSAFKNVSIKQGSDKNEALVVHPTIEPVLLKLLTTKPMWSYKLSAHSQDKGFFRVYVYDGDEELGYFEREVVYRGRSGERVEMIEIRNHRIAKVQERRNFKLTGDVAKAVSIIKKHFGAKLPDELVAEAKGKAQDVIRRAAWGHDRAANDMERTISSSAFAYVMSDPKSDFMTFLVDTGRSNIVTAMQKYEEISAEMKSLEAIREQFEKNKSALVVKYEGKYIVKFGDNINLYSDDTLPMEFRGKLGMLKLVENEQFVSNAGCKVTDEIFVLKTGGDE